MSRATHKPHLTDSEEVRLEMALARLVGSTRRSRRVKNLVEVAEELAVAESLLGSRRAVAQRIGISTEMLREFASVANLHPRVREMASTARLTSVDVAYRISMLPKNEQPEVAQAYVDKSISGKDVKDVVTFWRKHPQRRIGDAIARVKASRDIVQYVIKVRLPEKVSARTLRKRVLLLFREEEIVSLHSHGRIVTLVLTEEGRNRLQAEAKKRTVTRRRLIELVLKSGD